MRAYGALFHASWLNGVAIAPLSACLRAPAAAATQPSFAKPNRGRGALPLDFLGTGWLSIEDPAGARAFEGARAAAGLGGN